MAPRQHWGLYCLFSTLGFSASALAQESVTVLGEVTVASPNVGTLPTKSILTSVDVMTAERIQGKNVANSWELVGQMPGIQLTHTGMGPESGKLSFRGFNGEGYINGVKLLIDGVPSNVNSGNMRHIDMISPLDIEYVEVVRGTNDPRYGLHNIGGNVNIGTRQGGNYNEGRFTVGSFNTREMQLAAGRENQGFSQNYLVSTQNSDGYRDNAKSEKFNVAGKWFLSGDKFSAGIIARVHHNQSQEPGYLTAAELAADRKQSPLKNHNDHGVREMQHLSAHVDYQFNPNTSLSSKLYFNSIDDERFLTYSGVTTGNAARQKRDWREDHYGWMNTLTWRANEFATLEGGFNVEHQVNHYIRSRFNYTLPTDFSATPARIQNNDDYTLDNMGAYVQAIIKPAAAWKIIPAFRVDHFAGHTTLNNATNSGPFSLQDSGWIKQPKLSVVYSPVKSVSAYANWGKTFQLLTGSREPAYQTPSATMAYQPSINTGKEVGVKIQPFSRTEVRLAAWQHDAEKETANLPAANLLQTLGATRRKGIDFQLTSMLSEKFRFWLSHSIQESKVLSGTIGTVDLSGKEVFSTPKHISNAGIEYAASEAWRFDLQGRSQGSYFIDNSNALGKFGGYVLFDAGARYSYSKTVSVDFQLKNVFDRKYEYVWYDEWFQATPQALFSPGVGRAAYLSLNLKM